MPIIKYREHMPLIGKGGFIAPNAYVIGDVVLGDDVSVMYGAVLRGDLESIHVGSCSNIQDNVVVHTTLGKCPCLIGDFVSVGHGAILHSCRLVSRIIVGMNSVILDGAEIGANTIIGANSLVSMDAKIPSGVLAFGSPAKVVRDLKDDEIQLIDVIAKRYIEVGKEHASSNKRTLK